ncbi:MAG: 4-(cytidine 5'-diphospho)-2-C-methyl-D-erythritol kinase [Desulfobacterales bacterium]
MEIQAPAKINLYLDVVGRRSDGYHELVSLMCLIEIHDTLRFSFATAHHPGGIAVECSHPGVPPGRNNIAYRAASEFFTETGINPPGVAISIEKRIPVGAGLGGGSSNAAAVLRGLNSYFGHPVSAGRLMELGCSLGADVPFFLFGRPAVATGIGEKLSEFQGLPSIPVVVVYPGRPLSTAEVYKKFNLALTKSEKINKNFIFKPGWVADDVSKQLFNALEKTAVELCPEIGEAKKALLSSGAAGAVMTGSGSSVFGIYADTHCAESAYRRLSGQDRWRVFRTQLLT